MCYYAVARIGAVINPANVMLTPEEILFVLNDCGAKVILASRDKALPLLDVAKGSPLQQIIVFDGDAPTGTLSLNQLLSQASQNIAPLPTTGEDVSTIAYTSGTTGFPKGAVLSHRAVILNSAMTAIMHSRVEKDVVVTSLPTAHVYGNVVMNSAFMCGMTLVLCPRFDADEILRAIETHHATLFEGVPTMYMYLLDCVNFDKHSHTSLSRCTVGGQTMASSKMQEVEARFGCPLLELWGMTEIAGLGTTHSPLGINRHGSIGVPLPYVQCRIVDAGNAAVALGPGEAGELLVRGPIVMKEYYRNPSATLEAIEPDGWLHTGDLAMTDADGYFYIVDRKKDMILTAGYNIYPAEVERVISAHPGVSLVAVVGIAHDIKGEIARAYIVPKSGATLDEGSILDFCRHRLAAYKVPRSVRFLADLPKTSTGKIMRRQLKQLT